MNSIVVHYNKVHDWLFINTNKISFLAPLTFRIYLGLIFWDTGFTKLDSIDNVIEWFGNSEWGLGLPAPALMAWLATLAEIVGAICLFLGLAVRWMCIPLIITMIVAAVTAHWDNGWLAIATNDGFFATEQTREAIVRLNKAKEILQEYGNYEWLTSRGSFVVLNNGIEFAATYFVMLLSLLFTGAGNYVSLDYWLARHFNPKLIN